MAKPVPLHQLVRAENSLIFPLPGALRRAPGRERLSNAITARDFPATVHIPAATLGALLLGPGTTVSQQAMMLLAESGSTAASVGERTSATTPTAAYWPGLATSPPPASATPNPISDVSSSYQPAQPAARRPDPMVAGISPGVFPPTVTKRVRTLMRSPGLEMVRTGRAAAQCSPLCRGWSPRTTTQC